MWYLEVDIMINQFIIRKCIGVHGVHHMTSHQGPSIYVLRQHIFGLHLIKYIIINFIIRENKYGTLISLQSKYPIRICTHVRMLGMIPSDESKGARKLSWIWRGWPLLYTLE